MPLPTPKSQPSQADQPQHRHCHHCNYNLHAHSKANICPECGTPFDPSTPIRNLLRLAKLNRRLTILLLIPILLILPNLLWYSITKTINPLLAISTLLAIPTASILAAITATKGDFTDRPEPTTFNESPLSALANGIRYFLVFLLCYCSAFLFLFLILMLFFAA